MPHTASASVAHSMTRPPASVLLVEPTPDDVLSSVSSLSAAGFQVTVADTYAEAAALLSARPPNILITELRLGDYNGLQLVLRGKAIRPTMAALVTSWVYDVVLQREAEQLGATFVHKPIEQHELLAAVFRTLARADGIGPALTAPFERRVAQRRVAVRLVEQDRRLTERRAETLSMLGRFVAE